MGLTLSTWSRVLSCYFLSVSLCEIFVWRSFAQAKLRNSFLSNSIFWLRSDKVSIFLFATVLEKQAKFGQIDKSCLFMGHFYPFVGLQIAWVLDTFNKQTFFYRKINFGCVMWFFKVFSAEEFCKISCFCQLGYEYRLIHSHTIVLYNAKMPSFRTQFAHRFLLYQTQVFLCSLTVYWMFLCKKSQ